MSNRLAGAVVAALASSAVLGGAAAMAANLPNYDHIVIVVEENKDFEQIIGNPSAAYLNKLAAEGAVLTRMFAEEHNSEGNYFWLFSGSNQNVGFRDVVPKVKFTAANLGAALIAKGLTFKGYSQSLPAIGSDVVATPEGCSYPCVYGRKHVPWISFANVPDGTTVATSSNLRFADFPADYSELPTVAFVVPDMKNDMHNGETSENVPDGDKWLERNLDRYYQWAKTHNSLLIVTFDENDDETDYVGLTDPAISPDNASKRGLQNRIATIFAGARVKAGYRDADPLTHINILRTIEAIYGLPKSGMQQANALKAGIPDDATAAMVFAGER
jgi:phosphatidylinositol-3-phosphatase